MAGAPSGELERLLPIALDYLQRLARDDGMASYTQFCEVVGLDVHDPHQRDSLMSPLLGLVSRLEHAEGRPLLSAVVYGRANNEPGPGFDELRRELKMLKPRDITEFWIQELRRVHDHWRQR